MTFTQLCWYTATLGFALAGLLIVLSALRWDWFTLAIGVQALIGSIVLGTLAEISIALRK